MWEIFTFGGADFLRLVFNGIAAIFGDDNYNTAIALSAILGLLSIMVMGAFRKGELNIQWLLGIILLYQIALVPKQEIVIVDSIVPANNAVVDNVPMGIALTASLFSRFSNWATGAFETIFALPNDIRMRGNGLIFANTLVEESTRFEITTPQLSQNLSQFWKDCVFYDILLNRYTWQDLVSSRNLLDFLQNNTSIIRSFTYQDADGVRFIIECREGFQNNIIPDFENEVINATNIHGVRLAPNEVNMDASVAKFAATMPVAYQFLTGLALDNAAIISQNALANSLKRGIVNFASEADAPAAAQDFALARAEQERKTTFLTMGLVAKKMLPILQHLFEAFIYAIFPFVMLMAMTPMVGKVILSYVKVLFWINLWPPLFAILHFAVSYYSSNAASAAMVQQGLGFQTGLSIMTNTGLGKVMEDYAAIAGYLTISIPMIAWVMVSMSGAMMAGLAGRMIQGYENPVSKGADEGTTGNIGLGKVSYLNTTAFQENSSPSMDAGVINERLGSGSEMMTTAAGRYLHQNMSSGPMSIDNMNSYVESKQQELSNATSRMNTESSQLATANTAALNQSLQVMDRATISNSASSGMTETERNVSSLANESVDRAIGEWSEKNGIALTDELKGAIKGSIGASLEGETGFKLFGNGATFKAKASLEGSGTASTSESEKASYEMAKSFMGSNQYTEAVQSIAEGVRSLAVTSGVSTEDSTMEGLNASLQNQKSARHEYNEAVSDVESAKDSLSKTESFAQTYTTKGLDALRASAQEMGISTAEFDQTVTQMNQGGMKGLIAKEQLETLAEAARAKDSSLDFSIDQDTLPRKSYENNVTSVENSFTEKTLSIENGANSEELKETIGSLDKRVNDVFNDPNGARTINDHSSKVQNEKTSIDEAKEKTQDRVEKMRVLSDTPIAAGIAGEQIKERQVEELKERLFSKNKEEEMN